MNGGPTNTDTESDTAAGVLDSVRASRALVLAEEASQLQLAVDWAGMHSVDSILDAACFGDSPIPVAGPGAPLIAEFSVAEFAAALCVPTEVGKSYLGEAVELAHRLPRLWGRVLALELPGWRARRIAAQTIGLTAEAAAYVDVHIAHVAHKIGPAGTERLVDEAIARFMPDQAEAQRQDAADRIHLTVDHRQVSYAGTSRIHGELDVSDALDLDAAITARAARIKDLGSTASLDRRRAQALIDLVRRQDTLDLEGDTTEESRPARVSRELVIYVHLHPDGITARVENTGSLVTAAQVKAWCTNPYTRVTIKPVIDLNQHVQADGYSVPDSLKEVTGLRDKTCVFPWCTRPARRCDHDHVIPHAAGGLTCSCNIAPPLSATSPAEDPPRRLDLHHHRTGRIPVDQPPRLPVPPRPIRHPRRHPRPGANTAPGRLNHVEVRAESDDSAEAVPLGMSDSVEGAGTPSTAEMRAFSYSPPDRTSWASASTAQSCQSAQPQP